MLKAGLREVGAGVAHPSWLMPAQNEQSLPASAAAVAAKSVFFCKTPNPNRIPNEYD